MLSKITRLCGNIFTSLKNLAVKRIKTPQFFPIITFAIFLANTMIHFGGHGWGFQASDLITQPLSLFGYMFSHPTFEHLAGNMLFLLLFGPAVEKYFGHWTYLGTYLFCGALSALGWAYCFHQGAIVGASGAIAGIMAIYPFTKRSAFSCLVSGLAIGAFFVLQWPEAVAQINAPLGGTAFLGHIAGGVSGLIAFSYLRRN